MLKKIGIILVLFIIGISPVYAGDDNVAISINDATTSGSAQQYVSSVQIGNGNIADVKNVNYGQSMQNITAYQQGTSNIYIGNNLNRGVSTVQNLNAEQVGNLNYQSVYNMNNGTAMTQRIIGLQYGNRNQIIANNLQPLVGGSGGYQHIIVIQQ